MADNTEEEHLENPTNNQSEDLPDEIISANETDTINPNQENENMEVHHHAHHEGKKNWKSYFWEFLMLFLAVFCGFLAEYQLEHVIENQREKKYMQALLEETRLDISEYDNLLKRLHYIDPIADSLFYNVKQAEKYNFNLMSKWNTPFNNISVSYYPSLTAIQQLEHSGNLRLVKNQDLVRQIVIYETFVASNLKNAGTNLQDALRATYKLENNFCDLTDFNKSLSIDIKKSKEKLKLEEAQTFEMPLLTKDPLKLNELASSFVDFRGYINGYIIATNEAKQKATLLSEKIKEEYHFK